MTNRSASLSALIRQLESRIDDQAGGWPEEVFLFVSRITLLINVDLLIQDGSGRTLLTWRNDEFYGPGWHVPGGIIRFKETAADRILKVARRELGVDVEFDSAPIAVEESIKPSRQDRAHFISLLYRSRLVSDLDQNRRYTPANPVADQWLWHDGCPENLIEEQRAYTVFMG